MTFKEYAVGACKTAFRFLLIAYVFYESLLSAILLLPVGYLFFREWLEEKALEKEKEFRNQFKDSLQMMSAALRTGYSVENSVRETEKELAAQYGKSAKITKEYARMTRELNMSQPAERTLLAFSKRVKQEDVDNFVSVFAAAKKSGGDSISMIKKAIYVIGEKIDTEKEVDTILSARKLEFQVMSWIPFALILYMKLTFREFFLILYGNLAGITVMTVCLGIYLAAYFLGRHIIRINV